MKQVLALSRSTSWRTWLLAGALLLGAPAWSQGPAVTPQPAAPGVFFVQGVSALGSPENRNFISNAGFVDTGRGVVLIDALGSPALARELLGQIRRLTGQPVTHVIVTHYHADHVYGLQVWREQGAKIVAHRRAGEYLHSDTAQQRLLASRQELAPWVDENTHLVEPDVWLDGDTDLKVGNATFQIRTVGPAHTPEDLVVYVPERRTLFAGDLVFRGRVPFVGQADSRRWIEALDRLLAFDEARVILPGHGPLSTSAREDLQLTRDYLVYLRETMGRAAREMEPFDEAYAATDWSRFEKMPLFGVANRMNAYNTYLLMEQEAK